MRQSQKEEEIQRIVSAITEAISAQKIPPGTRLVENQLIDSLNANRNHVRTALQRLASKHLVSIKTNSGASVAKPSFEEAGDIFSARMVVERGVIECLINRLNDMDIAILKKQLKKEKLAIQSNCRADTIRESGNFHLLLAKLCGNTILEEMMTDLVARSSLIIALFQQSDNAQCCCDEHEKIFQYIVEKDVDSALALLDKHLQHLHLNQNLKLWDGKSINVSNIFG